MPVHQEVDAARGGIVARVYGEVTMDDILAAIDSAVRDPAFEPGFHVFSDHREIEAAITTEQVGRTAAHLKSLSDHLAGARWAIVTQKPSSYGMMRMLSVYAESVPMEVRVFESPEDAEAWLSSPKS